MNAVDTTVGPEDRRAAWAAGWRAAPAGVGEPPPPSSGHVRLMRLRSLLFAPANRYDLREKLAASEADVVVLDLEDAVPPRQKTTARDEVVRALPGLVARRGMDAVFVRVNDPTSPWFAGDVAALAEVGCGIVVPKLVSAEQIGDAVAFLVDGCPRPVIAGVETAEGIEAVRDVCRSPMSAVYFGAEDYVADLGGRRSGENFEVLYARSRVAIAARLGAIPAIDQVVVGFRDDARFHREAEQARDLGYSGKLCIHPRQVSIANAAFTPTSHEVARSRRLVEAYAAAERDGTGVIELDGEMIDVPLVSRARRTLELAGAGSED